VQVLVALVITPEGFPLAYEALSGNVTDNRTLHLFLRQIERQYGKAERIWLMDRGIPTEATLEQMRALALRQHAPAREGGPGAAYCRSSYQ
jgi:transposase